MLSANAIFFVLNLYCQESSGIEFDADQGDISENEQIEEAHIRVVMDRYGRLSHRNSMLDYFHRADSLADMSFYDFVRCIRLEKMSDNSDGDITEAQEKEYHRIDCYTRHPLKPMHPLASTHQLVEHYNPLQGNFLSELVPKIVGMKFPTKKDGWRYHLFTLVHFKPFSSQKPLLPQFRPDTKEQTLLSAFNEYEWPECVQQYLKNLEDINECQDQRDAERLRKLANQASERSRIDQEISQRMHAHNTGAENEEGNIVTELPSDIMLEMAALHEKQHIARKERDILSVMMTIQSSNWFACLEHHQSNSIHNIKFPDLPMTQKQITGWLSEASKQEKAYKQEQLMPHSTKTADQIIHRSEIANCSCISQEIQGSEIVNQNGHTCPGGTGKTHVVNAVKEVMAHYSMENRIRFLAPTGSAAALINGVTVHSGLGIKVKGRRKNDSEEHDVFRFDLQPNKRKTLRAEWVDVDVLMIDEVSLLGAQLLAEIDAMLRFAKEEPGKYFGGLTVVFAGDFFQFPPVRATALYSPIPKVYLMEHTRQTEFQVQHRIGRIAWKSVNGVISLTEQKRMKGDLEYADAVGRLRMRQCTQKDVELFNSRVIKSADNPNGIDMSLPENYAAAAIVRTNFLRSQLNYRKAGAVGGYERMVVSNDLANNSKIEKKLLRDFLLDIDTSSDSDILPGRIPLFEGMPVILKSRNLSTGLGITNGAQGIVRKFMTELDNFNNSDSLVHIPDLPEKWFPIKPVKCSFKTRLPSGEIVDITRWQLPLQPAYAVTGYIGRFEQTFIYMLKMSVLRQWNITPWLMLGFSVLLRGLLTRQRDGNTMAAFVHKIDTMSTMITPLQMQTGTVNVQIFDVFEAILSSESVDMSLKFLWAPTDSSQQEFHAGLQSAILTTGNIMHCSNLQSHVNDILTGSFLTQNCLDSVGDMKVQLDSPHAPRILVFDTQAEAHFYAPLELKIAPRDRHAYLKQWAELGREFGSKRAAAFIYRLGAKKKITLQYYTKMYITFCRHLIVDTTVMTGLKDVSTMSAGHIKNLAISRIHLDASDSDNPLIKIVTSQSPSGEGVGSEGGLSKQSVSIHLNPSQNISKHLNPSQFISSQAKESGIANAHAERYGFIGRALLEEVPGSIPGQAHYKVPSLYSNF
ncbi:hypothetical protein K435DRAFT_790095 [Dendrothele bispora CBS 962.96]|uniref:ATP-dependent DNA helicase n=1 Tax=Dendrothele bispora (strain CBS 962.96) TaxID=1314807 RepID=A0A4S8MRL5_DENBC|nr:hypothetical protein K435DRAFT_790095 [Dendrothele bispora CBS 962.96]